MKNVRCAYYLAKHKWFVYQAGRELDVPWWRLIVHDWSKLAPAEWKPYAAFFHSAEPDKTAFTRAWAHHVEHNPHHWQHWLDVQGRPRRMPEHFVREMVADWAGAGRAIRGSWKIGPWFNENRATIELHPSNWPLVHGLVRRWDSTHG